MISYTALTLALLIFIIAFGLVILIFGLIQLNALGRQSKYGRRSL